jgi:hypothetical protein
MNTKEFKVIFAEVAEAGGFKNAFDGWFKESSECIVVLHLQKSNFGSYFELNIKIFIQGLFGKTYTHEKQMVKNLPGDVFWRPPDIYKLAFDLNTEQNIDSRRKILIKLFEQFIIPTTEMALTKSGIINLKKMGMVYLLPAVESRLIRP